MVTISKSMAAKLNNLDDQKSGVNITTGGHALTSPSGENGPKEAEAFGSAPSHSPSQSLAGKPKSHCPETWY